ncbi:MAG: mechanosensitive ion channel [Magnetococcales bacterium]|nr:mechanosensitive ion channel [Magnetococcales bacterium]
MVDFIALKRIWLILFALVLVSVEWPLMAYAATNKPAAISVSVWRMDNPTDTDLTQAIASVQKDLEIIPKEATDKTADGQKRLILKQRLDMLEEWRLQFNRIHELTNSQRQWREELAGLQKALREESSRPAAAEPNQPTPDGFERIKSELERHSRDMEAALTTARERQMVLQEAPQQMQQAQERKRQAQEEIRKLQELSARSDEKSKGLLALRIENDRLRVRLAETSGYRWETEQRVGQEGVTLQDRRLELGHLRQRSLETAFALYQEALQRQQATVAREMATTLLAREQAAAAATTPDRQFLARLEADIARSQKQLADLNQLKTDVISAVSDQDSRLQREKDELKKLEALVQQQSASGRSADLLKEAFHDVSERHQALYQTEQSAVMRSLAELSTRSVELDALLPNLQERWRGDLDRVVRELEAAGNNQAIRPFISHSEPLLERSRRLLEEEKRMIVDIIAAGRRLQLLPKERSAVLDDTERLVLSHVFWIRDEAPLGWGLFKQLLHELAATDRPYSLLNWWGELLSDQTLEALTTAFSGPLSIGYGIGLFVLLPVALHRYRLRLRRLIREQLQRARQHTLSMAEWGQLLAAGLLAASFLPLHLVVTALAIETLALPAHIGGIIQQILYHLALVAALWRAARLFISPYGVGPLLLRLPMAVTVNLYQAVRVLLPAWLVFLLPWITLRHAPFHFTALPRLAYTLFEVALLVAIQLLIRVRSPLVQWTIGVADGATAAVTLHKRPTSLQGGTLLGRHWRWISPLLTMAMVVVLLLDVIGFRFGASQLARSGLWSILTLFLLTALYHAAVTTTDRLLKRRRHMMAVGVSQAERAASEERTQLARQAHRTIRVFFTLTGGVLLASYWGLNERAFKLLSGYLLYSVNLANGETGFVTLADLALFVLILIGSLWLMRQLPRLYELLLFPRLGSDAGVRYAVVTISRYLIFLVGLFSALSFLKLDLAQLGWLVAAVSVGIGFGLQEIVANFVSGIILLLERPIRVGDMITVGAITGRVTRINIRATTLINSDLQELLVPNRDLITKEVTNWTLASAMVRLVIRIGVAYGSNIEQVRTLLHQIASAQAEVLDDPAIEVWFMDHGDNALLFELRVCLPDPNLRLPVRDRLNTAINQAFRDHGIDIPFPQRQLHLSGLPPRSQVEHLFSEVDGKRALVS